MKSIATAIQEGPYIKVYESNGQLLFSKYGGELQGFTSSMVTIREGAYIAGYDARGNRIFWKHQP